MKNDFKTIIKAIIVILTFKVKRIRLTSKSVMPYDNEKGDTGTVVIPSQLNIYDDNRIYLIYLGKPQYIPDQRKHTLLFSSYKKDNGEFRKFSET